jgi:hypothetical protein
VERILQRERQIADGAQTLPGILLQAPPEHRRHRRRYGGR